MAFPLLTWGAEGGSLGWRHRQVIELNNLVDNKNSRMTKPEMPFIQGHFLTNEGSKRLGWRDIWGWPWIEAELTLALEEQLPSWKILNTEKGGMKFNENMVIFSEFVDRNKIFLNLRNMKQE
jgi:hypothetical protein